jgi:hypothetical protein
LNPLVKTKYKEAIKGKTLKFSSTSMRYVDDIVWNGDIFISNDEKNCPITTCTKYLKGCNTPISGYTSKYLLNPTEGKWKFNYGI